ncbi:MAG: hypothetical protein M1821_010059 [Bathelium mastoideum]|nr:MAG: hypothetical protein M1821_010059 [Bathelium mastoideum]
MITGKRKYQLKSMEPKIQKKPLYESPLKAEMVKLKLLDLHPMKAGMVKLKLPNLHLMKMLVSSVTAVQELRKKSYKRLGQHVHHLSLEHRRIARLEERLAALEKREPSPEPEIKVVSPARQPAIPSLNLVKWVEFKELSNKKRDLHHAIDVLVGDPVLFHQRQKYLSLAARPELTKTSANEVTDLAVKGFPERIRINSIPLLRILRNVTANNFDDDLERPLVILRPYKPLLYHFQELKEKLMELQNRWGVLPEELGAKDEKSSDDSAIGEKKDKNIVDTTKADVEESNQEEIKDAQQEEKEEVNLHETAEARDDLHCLLKFLERCQQHLESRLDSKRPRVQFQDLWHLFKPGTFVYTKKGPQLLWRVLQTTGGRSYLSTSIDEPTKWANMIKESPFTLDCYHLDYDGKEFGPIQRSFGIPPFEGWRDITSLDIFPVRYLEKSAEILKELTVRGESFMKASGVRHMYCKGRTLVLTPAGQPIIGVKHPEDIDSAVMIDFDRAFQFNPDWRPLMGFEDPTEQDSRETREMTLHELVTCGERGNCTDKLCCMNDNIVKDYSWDRQRMNDFFDEREKAASDRATDGSQLPTNKVLGEELKLLPNRVFGFVLRNRNWASMRMDQISEVEKDASGLSRLELPSGHERIINGLVKTHFKKREEMTSGNEDFSLDPVRAKGRLFLSLEDQFFAANGACRKRLIILLHGAPGVGKTSTAECVAVANAKPLFPITCGDLGMAPKDVESNLELNFQLAQSWGCVLLLDEADVFLAERLKPDVTRNALVSVFLRALEYYTGVLFLTTNRVGTLDEAFKSRIHMSLLYPALDFYQTTAIWTKHLKYLMHHRPDLVVDETDIMDFAKAQFMEQVNRHKIGWNGRQIRNALQTAIALADFESNELSTDKSNPVRPVLKRESFQRVAKTAFEFDEYLKKTLQQSLTDYTNSQHWRTDTYGGPLNPSIQTNGTTPDWGSTHAQPQGPQWPGMANTTPVPNNIPGYGGMNPNFASNPPMQAGYNQAFPGQNSMGNVGQGVGQPNMGMQSFGQMATGPNVQGRHGQGPQGLMTPTIPTGQGQMSMPPNVQMRQDQASAMPNMQSPPGHTANVNAIP